MDEFDEHIYSGESEKIRLSFNQIIPPEELRNKVIVALKNKGLIKSNSIMKKERFFWMAATVAGIIIGFIGSTLLTPKDSTTSVSSIENQYLLLLHEDSTFSATESEIPRLIKEYTTWSNDLRKTGDLIAAEKLTNESYPFGGVPSSKSLVSGFFVIRATSVKGAIELAKTHPHLKYHGGIEVKPIDKLN